MSSHPTKSAPRIPAVQCEPDGRSSDKSPSLILSAFKDPIIVLLIIAVAVLLGVSSLPAIEVA